MNKIFEKYEKEYNVKIPSFLRLFIEKDFFSYFLSEYYDKKEKFIFPTNSLHYTTYDGIKLIITGLIRKNSLEKDIDLFNDMVDYQKDFFPLSFEVFPYCSWLLVGINKTNFGQIWITDEDAIDGLKYLQVDFFEFFLNCDKVLNEFVDIDKLYKKYGNDYWETMMNIDYE